MSVIFSDSILRMSMFVSLCGYMKGNILNCMQKGGSLGFSTSGCI